MKKTIIFGCLFSVFLLLILPNISATQYQLTTDVIEDKLENIQELSFINTSYDFVIICTILETLFITSLFLLTLFMRISNYFWSINFDILMTISAMICYLFLGICEGIGVFILLFNCDLNLTDDIKDIKFNLLPLIDKELYKITSLEC